MLLVDTSVILPCLRRSTKQAFLALLSELADEDAPAISMMTRFEVMAGTPDEHREVNRRFLDGFTQVGADGGIADLAGRLFFEWMRKGHTLSPADLFIGATAKAHAFVLLTGNSRHFPYLKERERRTIHYQSAKSRRTSDTLYFME